MPLRFDRFGEVLDLRQQGAAFRRHGLGLLQALLQFEVFLLEHAHIGKVPFFPGNQLAFAGQVRGQRGNHEDVQQYDRRGYPAEDERLFVL